MVVCPSCNSPMPEGANFCTRCGSALAPPPPPPAPEDTFAVIPKVMLRDWKGERECSLLLTNLRSIFVVERTDNYRLGFLVGLPLGGAVGGVLGGAVAGAERARRYDYANIPGSAFAGDPNNVLVPHLALQVFRARGGLDEIRIDMKWVDPWGQVQALRGAFGPPAEMFSEKRFLGKNRPLAVEEYGRAAMEGYRRAMPPDVFARTQWGFEEVRD